jgi:hypothetical protein
MVIRFSTSVNHAVVAEFLHGARRERGFYSGLYGTRVAALVTGHACLRRERRRTRKTVICAGRALADCTEDEIGGHHASLSRTGSIVRVHRGNCPGGALPLPRFLAGARGRPSFTLYSNFAGKSSLASPPLSSMKNRLEERHGGALSLVGNGFFLVFDHETGHRVFDDFRDGTPIECDDRRAAGHCFNQNQSERLGPGDRR